MLTSTWPLFFQEKVEVQLCLGALSAAVSLVFIWAILHVTTTNAKAAASNVLLLVLSMAERMHMKGAGGEANQISKQLVPQQVLEP